MSREPIDNKYVRQDLVRVKRNLVASEKYVKEQTHEALEFVDDLMENGFSRRIAGKLLTRLRRLDVCEDSGEIIYYSQEPEEEEHDSWPVGWDGDD